MTRPSLDALGWLRRQGPLALAGAALLAGAGLAWWGGVQPLRAEIADLQHRRSALQQPSSIRPALEPQPLAEQLHAFQRALPSEQEAPMLIDVIHAAAAGHGVLVRSGEYRLEQQDKHLVRYHVVLPVSGSYIRVREFISMVLAELPAASLDDVQMRREPGAGSAAVEARLKFSLHLRARAS